MSEVVTSTRSSWSSEVGKGSEVGELNCKVNLSSSSLKDESHWASKSWPYHQLWPVAGVSKVESSVEVMAKLAVKSDGCWRLWMAVGGCRHENDWENWTSVKFRQKQGEDRIKQSEIQKFTKLEFFKVHCFGDGWSLRRRCLRGFIYVKSREREEKTKWRVVTNE